MARKKTSLKKEPSENPLISNLKLQQIYTKIVEARLFDQHLTKLQRHIKPTKRGTILGQEACRVSALIDLEPGDLISDMAITPVTELILGAEVGRLLKHLAPGTRTKRRVAAQHDNIARQLPAVTDPKERLEIAMGAALALKTAKQGKIVVAFVGYREMGGSKWQKVLTLARQLELPMIFVVLPSSARKDKTSRMMVCDKARRAEMPGIPADAADAVALYRIIQESLGRTRAGDGPVLIECLTYKLPGQRSNHDDPIGQMKKSLLQRGISHRAALDAASKRFLYRLKRPRR